MIDYRRAGVGEEAWREATASCHELKVARIVEETHDARSIHLEIPGSLRDVFRYQAGQFLSFKVPFEGQVLARSYSLSSSPDVENEHKVTVKRVEGGRVSNLFNDGLGVGDRLMVVPPAGRFVLREELRPLLFLAGGSGVTPVISLIKSALHTTKREIRLVYANRDRRSIIFESEFDSLMAAHRDRLRVEHSLDDRHGFLGPERIRAFAAALPDSDFYLCGPEAFMDVVEEALGQLAIPSDRVHIERFVSPPEAGASVPTAQRDDAARAAPEKVSIVLDGTTHELPYQAGERLLDCARRGGLSPPFSCEEGYCSCCMAKLMEGRVEMAANDCLTEDLLEEGWILTCQAECVSGDVKIEYPD